MASQKYVEAVRKVFDELFTKGNLNSCDQYFDKDLKFHDPSAPSFRGGLQAFKEREKAYHKAFPGKKCTIEDIFESGDKVVVRWSVQGTHGGDLPGIPKTGKRIQVTGIMILKFQGQQITEIWQTWDRLGLLEQVGQVQPQAAMSI